MSAVCLGDLPTEGQWEYACRAGTTGDRNGEVGMAKLGRGRDTGWPGKLNTED